MWPEVWIRSLRCAAYDDPGVATRAAEILDDGERRRWHRLAESGARRDYLAAHLLRRGMLAALSGIDAAAFRFRSSRDGRPRIVQPGAAAALTASLSHADGVALCAVAEGLQVGADVESRRSLSGDLPAIAALVDPSAALGDLTALSPEARAERFLRFWTLREAIGKACGAGLAAPDAGPILPSVWQFACWWPTPDHLAAVAVRRAGPQRIRLRIDGEVIAACA